MAEAVVGDDVFLEDPTLNKLQTRAAEVYNYEMGALSAVAGVLPRIVEGEDGLLSWETISKAIRPKVYYRPQTALICLENTVNMAGGTVLPTSMAGEICDRAHEQDIHVHLDGARVFNAATYLREKVADMTKKFDSVQFCLSKGLGAPVGSMIVGTRDFIERCRSIRKMLGGGMRQAGVLAAAGLVAKAETLDGTRVVAAEVGETDADQLRALADRVRQSLGSGVVVLGGVRSGEPFLVIGVTKDLVGRLSANDLIKEVQPLIEGKGGGRPELASAGGKKAAGLAGAIAAARSAVRERLDGGH